MKNEYKVGMFFMLGILVLVIVMDFLGEIPFRSNTKIVYTYFDSVGELREGNAVKIKGLVIGKISSINLENRKLKVTMEVQKNAPVKNDSVASIQLSSLLGTSYINLTFGSDTGALTLGDAPLPSKNPTELNQILTKLDSSIDSLDNALGVFGMLSNNSQEISSIFTNLDTVMDNLATGKGTIGKLVNDDTLYKEVGLAVKELRKASEKLNNSDSTIGKLMNDDRLYVQATKAAEKLNKILKKVNSGKGTLGKLVNDDSLYYDAKNTTLKIEKGVDTLEDLAPVSTLGAILGILTVF